MDTGAAMLARLRANGLTVALTDSDRIQVRPRERVTREMDRWIRARREEMVAALRAEQQPSATAAHPHAAGEYTEVPNAFIDLWAPQLTEAELRVLLYLIRRTAGFHREQAAVSVAQLACGMCTKDGRQLDRGTGMNRKSIFRALDRLEARGLIERTRTDHAGDLGGRNIYRVLLHSAGVPDGTTW